MLPQLQTPVTATKYFVTIVQTFICHYLMGEGMNKAVYGELDISISTASELASLAALCGEFS